MNAHVRTRPPPGWVIRYIAGPLLHRVLPGRAGRLLPGMALLQFRGRRTGAAYSVPVGVYDYEGLQVVFTDARWAMNFQDRAPVDVVRRGRIARTDGELVSDPGYVGPAIRAALDSGTSTTMLGLAIDRGHRPTDDELAAVRRAVVIYPHPSTDH